MLKQIRIDPIELQRNGPRFIGFVVIYDRAGRHPLLLACKPKYYLTTPRDLAPVWVSVKEALYFGQERTQGFWAYQLPHCATDQDVVDTITRILAHDKTIERLAPDGVLWVTAPGKKSLYQRLKTQLRERKLLQITNK